ncbi:MAG: oligosaccharide flippase family protein [Candidatus Margulisiibacteriota bacterium]
MNPLKLVAKGSILSLSGDTVVYLCSYLFLFIASHLLGQTLLGAYYWAISITSLIGEFAESGTGQGLIYFTPRFESLKGENQSLPLLGYALRFTLRNALFLAVTLFFLAPYIATAYHKQEQTWLLQLAAIGLPLSVFWPILYKYCVGRFKIVEGILFGDITRSLLRVIILLLLIVFGLKPLALIGTEVLVGLVLFIIGFWLINKMWGIGFIRSNLSKSESKELLIYSIPFLPLNLARGERITLLIAAGFLLLPELGLFGVVLKLAALSQVVLTAFNFVFRPMVAKLYAEKDFSGLSLIYKSITRWIFIFTLPISYILIFYPATVLSLFGNNFKSGATALLIVAIGYLFEYGTSATQVIINMAGKSWLSLFNQIVYFLVIAALSILLIPRLHANGAAIAVAGGIVIINLLRLYQSYKILGFTPYSWYLVKPAIAVFIAGITCKFLFSWGPILSIIDLMASKLYNYSIFTNLLVIIKLADFLMIYLAIYMLIVILLKIDHQDKELLLALKSKFIH